MQTKIQSLIEIATQQTIGFIVGLLSQFIIFPLLDIQVNMSESLVICVYFTIVSSVRTYITRRYFNRKHRPKK